MPTPTKYDYTVSTDCPGGVVNTTKLANEIRASAIATALDRIDTAGGVMSVWFKDALSVGDKTLLDNNTLAPAGGLIAANDTTPNVDPIQSVKFDTPQFVWRKPTPVGTRGMLFSQDFTKKQTWFRDSVAVANEAVGTGDGVVTVFNLANGFVIDLMHGLISDENYITKPGGGSYVPVVTVNGVTKAEREYGLSSGGDYTINYITGAITFFTPPPNGHAVVCTYHYSPANAGSVYVAGPPSGKTLVITAFEMNLSADVSFDDTIITAAFIDPQVFGLPAGPKMEVPGTRQYFKNMDDVINYTQRSWPAFPAFVGANGRGMTKDRYQLRFDYGDTSVMSLSDAAGLELRMWLEHHVPFGGEKACVTFEGFTN